MVGLNIVGEATAHLATLRLGQFAKMIDLLKRHESLYNEPAGVFDTHTRLWAEAIIRFVTRMHLNRRIKTYARTRGFTE